MLEKQELAVSLERVWLRKCNTQRKCTRWSRPSMSVFFAFAVEAVETNERKQEAENGEKANSGGGSVYLNEMSTGRLLYHIGLGVHVTWCSDLGLWATHCIMKENTGEMEFKRRCRWTDKK